MKKLISAFMAAVFLLSFSSVALASNGPEVQKTYKFKYFQINKSKYDDGFKYRDYVRMKNSDSYKAYLEFRKDHKNIRISYKEFLKWLELLQENNHSFGNVYLQGYENGVAIYR